MIKGKKVVVVMPAYNAAHTLERTYRDIPFGVVDEVIVVDDASTDATRAVAEKLQIQHFFQHAQNRGYGANQKTCYHHALALEADIIVMLHPDYQYTPKLMEAMVSLIANKVYPVVLGSRILGNGALKGGMPLYKFLANRVLTLIQNLLLNQKLSEYHTGYRAFAAEVLRELPIEANSDDFIFDNQLLAQIALAGHEVAEITCPTRYFPEASSINFQRSIRYGLGVLAVSLQYRLARWAIYCPSYLRSITSSTGSTR